MKKSKSGLDGVSPYRVGDAPPPGFWEAFRFWLKLGFISFGGPAGQIAIMHTEVVERRKWISEDQFLRYLNFCTLLPGPEAQQLATSIGWRLHGMAGAIVAGSLFFLPAAVLLWVLSWVYVTHGNVAWVSALFYGLKPAVIAILAAALFRIGRKALKTKAHAAVAVVALVALYFKVPFPLVILAAGVAGFFLRAFETKTIPVSEASSPPKPSGIKAALKTVSVCLLLWWLPVLALGLSLGWGSTPFQQGVFFSKTAMVTFGGAYAVLPYVAQKAVEQYAWLAAPQMLDGLGLAETTPGPLIMVLQFVGFMGGWNHPGTLSPMVSATLCAAVTTWCTFLPCFLWILTAAPHLDRLGQKPKLNAALSAITAAVVGVIANLAFWFAAKTLFRTSPLGVDWFALVLAVAAFIAAHRFKVSTPWIVLGCALAGLAGRFIG